MQVAPKNSSSLNMKCFCLCWQPGQSRSDAAPADAVAGSRGLGYDWQPGLQRAAPGTCLTHSWRRKVSLSLYVCLHFTSTQGKKTSYTFWSRSISTAVLAGSRSCHPLSASNDVRCCGWPHVHRWTKAPQWGEELAVVPRRPAGCFQQVKLRSRNRHKTLFNTNRLEVLDYV